MTKFLQIHTLTGFSSVLLNRDDTGMAKRIEYGDGVRTRTSSQFAKRKMRIASSEDSLMTLGDMSVRSRLVFRKKVAEPLIEEGLERSAVVTVTRAVMDAMYAPSEKALEKRKKAAEKEAKQTGEIDDLAGLERDELIILGQVEIDFIKNVIRDVIGSVAADDITADALGTFVAAHFKDKKVRETLRSIPNTALDIAAFGRMVTGDSVSSMDAAVHVAHAITVHTQQSEVDYFTAVDDLKNRAEGADVGVAHIGETEINSPLLYAYYVIDIGLLKSNLAGLDNPSAVAAKMAANIMKLAATSIVGAKKGSTAPYSTADFIMAEIGDDAPRSLAEAFREPVRPTIDAAVAAISSYMKKKEAIYGPGADTRLVMTIVPTDVPSGETINLAAAQAKLVEILSAA